MRTAADRRRREQFVTDCLALALDNLGAPVLNRQLVPGGSPNGADSLTATVVVGESVWDVDGPTMAAGFGRLFRDRLDNGGTTGLERVSTAWRDRMLQARAVSSTAGITPADAVRILKLALDISAHAR